MTLNTPAAIDLSAVLISAIAQVRTMPEPDMVDLLRAQKDPIWAWSVLAALMDQSRVLAVRGEDGPPPVYFLPGTTQSLYNRNGGFMGPYVILDVRDDGNWFLVVRDLDGELVWAPGLEDATRWDVYGDAFRAGNAAHDLFPNTKPQVLKEADAPKVPNVSPALRAANKRWIIRSTVNGEVMYLKDAWGAATYWTNDPDQARTFGFALVAQNWAHQHAAAFPDYDVQVVNVYTLRPMSTYAPH